MNIKEVNGNIVDCPAGVNVILHQANINRQMGAGVAKALCDKWPIVRKTDENHKPNQQYNSLGDFSACQVEANPSIVVFNVYAQSIFFDSLAGCRTDYNAAIVGFAGVRDILVKWDDRDNAGDIVVGIPKLMGCGLAGGNWGIYYKIIEETFKDTSLNIAIVNFNN